MSDTYVKISVVVLEDDPGFVDSLRAALARSGRFEEPLAFDDVARAFQSVTADVPSVVLVDLRLPCDSGVRFVHKLRSAGVRCPVVMVTGSDAPEDVISAFKAGSDGYWVKSPDIGSLVESLIRAVAGEPVLSDAAVAALLDDHIRSVAAIQKVRSLRPRAQAILRLTAEGLGCREIAERMRLDLRVIYRENRTLMAKLGASSRSSLAALWREGDTQCLPLTGKTATDVTTAEDAITPVEESRLPDKVIQWMAASMELGILAMVCHPSGRVVARGPLLDELFADAAPGGLPGDLEGWTAAGQAPWPPVSANNRRPVRRLSTASLKRWSGDRERWELHRIAAGTGVSCWSLIILEPVGEGGWESQEEQTRLLPRAAHDFRNRLTSACYAAEAAEALLEGARPVEALPLVGKLRESLAGCAGFFEDLQAAHRIMDPAWIPRPVLASPTKITAWSLKAFEVIGGSRGTRLEVSGDASVQIDPVAFSLVVRNVVLEVAHAAGGEAPVLLLIQVDAGRCRIEASADSSAMRASVSDGPDHSAGPSIGDLIIRGVARAHGGIGSTDVSRCAASALLLSF